MTKDSIELALAVSALIVGGSALIVGTFALAFVVGIKNSTHQVVWKPVDEPKPEDPFGLDAVEENVLGFPEVNPNKKIIKNNEEDFADLADPEVTSNDWSR